MNQSAHRFNVSFRDTLSLAHAWMPFIEGGALFVPTSVRPALGETVFVLVTLEVRNERYALTGAVVWLSAPAPTDGSSTGIGIRLPDDDNGRKLYAQITDSLGNIQFSLKKTATL